MDNQRYCKLVEYVKEIIMGLTIEAHQNVDNKNVKAEKYFLNRKWPTFAYK